MYPPRKTDKPVLIIKRDGQGTGTTISLTRTSTSHGSHLNAALCITPNVPMATNNNKELIKSNRKKQPSFKWELL